MPMRGRLFWKILLGFWLTFIIMTQALWVTFTFMVIAMKSRKTA